MSSNDQVEVSKEHAIVTEDESRVSTSSAAPIDPAAERRLKLKCDLHIFPILYIIYMMSFLDRINIGNAKIQGMAKELNLTGNRYNIALFVYFIPYILLEVPSNLILKRVRPSIYISVLMLCWGIINMCMGWVKTYQGLVALRFFLGVFEAGVMPGIVYLTSMYYKRHEFQKRLSFFFTSTLVGGAIGGLLAYAIADLNGKGGFAGWQWIFIIEGIVTIGVSLLSFFLIADWPEDAKFLSAEEKDLLKRRIAEDNNNVTVRMDKLNSFSLKLILKDWKIWFGSFIYMGIGTTGYAGSFFLPTILLEFGWTARSAQVHTIPVYVVSIAVCLIFAFISDRIKHRYSFIIIGAVIATIGYGMLLNQQHLSRGAKYAATFLILTGGNSATPIALVWLTNNMGGHYKRSIGSGMQVSFGNIAGIIGSNIFLAKETPRFTTGYGTALGMLWVGALAATLLAVGVVTENKKRNEGKRDYRLQLPQDQLDNMGDDHPSFRYTL